MKKYLVIAVLPALLFMFLTAGAYQVQAAEKVINLKYQLCWSMMNKNSILQEQWGKEIEKRTNGRVKFTYYPVGAIIPLGLIYDGIVKGLADIGGGVLGYTRGRFPLTEVIDLPLGYNSGYQATLLINEYYKKFRPKEFDDAKVLYLSAHGPGLLWSKKPVNKLEDMKGLKVRSTGLSAKLVTALGGVPVGMPISEAYDALSKGVADAIMVPAEAMAQWKLGEVVSYSIETYSTAYTSGFFVTMNKDKWNALPPDIQKIFEAVSEEWIPKQGRMWDEVDKDGNAFMTAKGAKVIKLSKEEEARWAEKARPILDDYAKSMKEKGLPGDEALKFCVDWLKAHL